MVGYGHNAPSHSQNQAASCYPAPTQCNAVSSELSPLANPNVLYGALVEGDGFSDTLPVCTQTTSASESGYSAACFNLQAQIMHAPPHPVLHALLMHTPGDTVYKQGPCSMPTSSLAVHVVSGAVQFDVPTYLLCRQNSCRIEESVLQHVMPYSHCLSSL
jgi:hypothetical protein